MLCTFDRYQSMGVNCTLSNFIHSLHCEIPKFFPLTRTQAVYIPINIYIGMNVSMYVHKIRTCVMCASFIFEDVPNAKFERKKVRRCISKSEKIHLNIGSYSYPFIRKEIVRKSSR